MASYDFVTVNVFPDKRFASNSLAVPPDANCLIDARMRVIAAAFNLPETTFVMISDNVHHQARVHIFTLKSDMSFARHSNVDTGFLLATMVACTRDDELHRPCVNRSGHFGAYPNHPGMYGADTWNGKRSGPGSGHSVSVRRTRREAIL